MTMLDHSNLPRELKRIATAAHAVRQKNANFGRSNEIQQLSVLVAELADAVGIAFCEDSDFIGNLAFIRAIQVCQDYANEEAHQGGPGEHHAKQSAMRLAQEAKRK